MFSNGQPGAGQNIVPIKFILIDSSSQHEVYTRPYSIEAKGAQYAAIHAVGDRLARESSITPGLVAGYANQLLMPEAIAGGIIQIPNGWMQKRLRFIIEFQVTDGYGDQTFEVITGYTDFDDPSYSGMFNGQMRLYFNNVVKLRATQRVNEFGVPYMTKSLVNSMQLLSVRDGVAKFNAYAPANHQVSMTPGNVLAQMEWQATPKNGGTMTTLDSRIFAGANGGIATSNRRNNLASNYICDTINAARVAATQASTSSYGGVVPSVNHIYSNARSTAMAGETMLTEDQVMGYLIRATSFTTHNSVSWAEILGLFPTLDSIGIHIQPGVAMNDFNQYLPDPDGYSLSNLNGWQGSNIETQVSTSIANAVPSLMVDTLLSEVMIRCSNMTLNGTVTSEISARSFLGDGVDITLLAQAFVARFESELVPLISRSGNIDFMMNMSCQIAGETKITIQLGNNTVLSYTYPSYCDNLGTPVLSKDHNRIAVLAHDLTALTTPLIQAATTIY